MSADKMPTPYTHLMNGTAVYTAEQMAEAVADERERCALLCERMHPEDKPSDYAWAIRAG